MVPCPHYPHPPPLSPYIHPSVPVVVYTKAIIRHVVRRVRRFTVNNARGVQQLQKHKISAHAIQLVIVLKFPLIR